MLDIIKTANQLAELWKLRATFKGLIGFFIVVNSALILLVSTSYFILREGSLIGHFINFVFICGIVVGTMNLLIFVFWISWRQIPRVPIGKNAIFFAPHSDMECTDLIHKLYAQFKLDIRKRGLAVDFMHCFLPSTRLIKDHKDAQILLLQSGARLVIHGFLDKGNINGESYEGFKQISFTIRHRQLNESENEPVMRSLAAAMSYRAFSIGEKNSYLEKNLVINNISEVACFFLAMSLCLDGKVSQSLEILEHLSISVNEKIKHTIKNKQIILFHDSIKNLIMTNFIFQFNDTYNVNLIDNITDRKYDNDAETCLQILNRIKTLTGATFQYYLHLAIIHFHFCRINEALDAVFKAQKLAPKDNGDCYLSSAFLNLWNDNYRDALKDYLKLTKFEFHPEVIMSVIRFLQGLLILYPKKFQLKFALAFINEGFFDIDQAKNDYEAFLKETDGNYQFQMLHDYAKARYSRVLKISKQ